MTHEESIMGLELAEQFLKTPEHSGFTLINDSQKNAENNIIQGKYYIIHMTKLNIILICKCYIKGFLRSDIKVIGKIEKDVIDVISPIFYISYHFASCHYIGIEFIKLNQYEKCDVYIYDYVCLKIN